jgi:hypothetical protein
MITIKMKKPRHDVEKGPFVVLSFFLALWFIGIAADEPGRVLEQAVRICLSCIGIG